MMKYEWTRRSAPPYTTEFGQPGQRKIDGKFRQPTQVLVPKKVTELTKRVRISFNLML